MPGQLDWLRPLCARHDDPSRGGARLWRRAGQAPGVRALLADAAVDPLAEQVRVAEMAGVLLDHVEYHLAQRDGSAVLHRTADGEVGCAGDELFREGDLLAPGLPGVCYYRRICCRARPVGVLDVAGPVQRGRVGPGH